jgi:hypothetical protein
MNEAFLREKAAMCLRWALSLSPSNPSRFHLLELAKSFHWRARELEEAEPRRAKVQDDSRQQRA